MSAHTPHLCLFVWHKDRQSDRENYTNERSTPGMPRFIFLVIAKTLWDYVTMVWQCVKDEPSIKKALSNSRFVHTDLCRVLVCMSIAGYNGGFEVKNTGLGCVGTGGTTLSNFHLFDSGSHWTLRPENNTCIDRQIIIHIQTYTQVHKHYLAKDTEMPCHCTGKYNPIFSRHPTHNVEEAEQIKRCIHFKSLRQQGCSGNQ